MKRGPYGITLRPELVKPGLKFCRAHAREHIYEVRAIVDDRAVVRLVSPCHPDDWRYGIIAVADMDAGYPEEWVVVEEEAAP